ncbi:MAG: NAD-dependent protein deacetylase [Pseudomonadota bacterium]|nr:NAD-dependent protein deacetylase [Pseudomonadota bacterium]
MQPLAKAENNCFEQLLQFVEDHPRLMILSGAGCSTESGIPDYRDHEGQWKHRQPMRHDEFMTSHRARQRYWAGSMIGWPRFAAAQPNAAHVALVHLETAGYVHQLVTQNVDGLHQRAGSQRVIDLHGRLDRVDCTACGHSLSRYDLQQRLVTMNAQFLAYQAAHAPDGDADLDGTDLGAFRVPDCPCCDGLLKPAVTFFGDSVPTARVNRIYQRLSESDALLVIGSSLMVYSAFRFCRAANEQQIPMVAINLGRTRADEMLRFKIPMRSGEALTALARRLAPSAG